MEGLTSECLALRRCYVFGRLIEYEYERTPTVNQKRLKFDGAMYAAYNFDDAGRLVSLVNSADSSTITFGYDNEDKVTSRVYPNGVTTTYEYFNNDLLKRLKDANTTAVLFDRQYTYSSANQIDSITELTGTRVFGYDLVDRLKTVHTNGTQTEFYNYDDVGNRTSSHLSAAYGYQSGKFNQLISTATANYQFDANGNTVSKGEGSSLWRYIWDYENRLTQASTRKQNVRYRYDALGRRVERNLGFGKERTKFIHDGLDVLLDDDSGTLTKYLNGRGIDSKLRVQTGATVGYFLSDHLASTNGLTDTAGGLPSQTTYDSFGNQISTLPTRYGFTGRERDDFSGLNYYRARFYDPKAGRFTSEDPVGFRGGNINLYGYVQNQPLKYVDPLGKFGWCRNGDGRPVPCGSGFGAIGDELFRTPNSSIGRGWEAESSNFPNGAPDGTSDVYGGAYRHCVATCYLYRRYSPFGGVARSIWDWVNEDSHDANSQLDMAGEDFGAVCSSVTGSCEKNCLQQYPSR